MYKELILSIIVVVCIVVADFITQNYTKNMVQEVAMDLESLRKEITKEEVSKEESSEKIKQIYENWLGMHDKLGVYIEHDELEKVDNDLVATRSNIEMEEYATGVERLDSCIFLLEHIKDKQEINLVNIF